jgi:glycosidase
MYLKQGSPFIYHDNTHDIVGIKDVDGGETYFASFGGGVGVPPAGTANQVLAKNSNSDYDMVWVTPAAGGSVPNGGTTGQALAKTSNADGAASWQTLPTSPPGGTTGQVLSKVSNANNDVTWTTPTNGTASFEAISANTTVSTSGRRLAVDATAGNITITLAGAATINDIIVKKIDASANTVTIDANASETIDGGLTAVLTDQFEAIAILSNGTNWLII